MPFDKQTEITLFTMHSLKNEGNWCGETHVQKTLYICQEMAGVPAGYKFILYKHGPYSFELSDKLDVLAAEDVIRVEVRPPYGPSLVISEGRQLFGRAVDELAAKKIQFICQKINTRGVFELEKLATALYVSKTSDDALSVTARAEKVNALKPHVTVEAAAKAIREIDSMTKELASTFQ